MPDRWYTSNDTVLIIRAIFKAGPLSVRDIVSRIAIAQKIPNNVVKNSRLPTYISDEFLPPSLQTHPNFHLGSSNTIDVCWTNVFSLTHECLAWGTAKRTEFYGASCYANLYRAV